MFTKNLSQKLILKLLTNFSYVFLKLSNFIFTAKLGKINTKLNSKLIAKFKVHDAS
jgi:hypothetical protein